MNSGFCTNRFKLSRGVRQGCPLYPYVFIPSVEILEKMQEAKKYKVFRSLKENSK